LIKSVRGDLPPCKNGQQLAEMLVGYRQQAKLTQESLATKFKISLGTIKNWERGRTKPSKLFWKQIRKLSFGF